MRILFLDFDGVLHPGDPEFDGEKFCWLPVLERLLIDHVDVRIVVHSSWRYDHTDAELKQLLGRLGDRFAGSAPRGPRALAIESVLQANHGVHSHLVLDDSLREFVDSRVRLLHVDAKTGISPEMVQAAILAWVLSTATLDSFKKRTTFRSLFCRGIKQVFVRRRGRL